MEFCPITDSYTDAVQITGRINILNDEHEQLIIQTINEKIHEGIFKTITLAKETKKKNGQNTHPHFHFSYIPSYAFYQEKLGNKRIVDAFQDILRKPLQKQLTKYTKETKTLLSFKQNTANAFKDLTTYIKGLAYTIKQETLSICHNEDYLQDALDLSRNYTEEHQQKLKASSKEALLLHLQTTQLNVQTLDDLQDEIVNYYNITDLLVPPPTRFKSITIWIVHKQYPAFKAQVRLATKQTYYL
uniref:hypothetical protein n=1 Tax=Algoriphagus sp. TaxID=1872435 RepID=UPI0040483233